MCVVASSDFPLLLLLVAVGPGSSCAGVISGEEDLALRYVLGADALLDLACAFALGAGVDERRAYVLGVGNAGVGFNYEYTGNAHCGSVLGFVCFSYVSVGVVECVPCFCCLPRCILFKRRSCCRVCLQLLC